MNVNEPINLDKLEQLARAATPGPWKWHESYGSTALYKGNTEDTVLGAVPCGYENSSVYISDPDAAYIAAVSPDSVLALIEQLRERMLDAVGAKIANLTLCAQPTDHQTILDGHNECDILGAPRVLELTPTLSGPIDDPQIVRGGEHQLTLAERIRWLGADRHFLREEVRTLRENWSCCRSRLHNLVALSKLTQDCDGRSVFMVEANEITSALEASDSMTR